MNLSLSTVRRAITIGAAVLGASVLAPQAASASVSCTYDAGPPWVIVKLDAGGDQASVAVQGTKIAVNGVACGAATVVNTDTILISDVSAGGGTKVEIDSSNASFAPGVIDEGFDGEIEMVVSLGGGTDTLTVTGSNAGASIVLGTNHINLNAEELGQDSDVDLYDVDKVVVRGGPGPDWISGHGDAVTGIPYQGPLALYGGAGDDELHGGDAACSQGYLDAGAGNDSLVAGSHGAALLGGAGDDTIVGGAGADEAVYAHAPAGVHVDLAAGGPQDTGGAGVDTISGVEWLSGSDYDDVLKGDGHSNVMSGGAGDDAIDGRDGPDYLDGGYGADTLRAGAGDGEVLDGGDGEDTAAYDDRSGPVRVDLTLAGLEQRPDGTEEQTLSGIESLLGSPFTDRLTGSAGANAIDGGAGADMIDGGEGADRLGGGAGIDTIDSRDASPDSVSCGEGPDSLATDALDSVAPDCAPPGEPGGPAGAGAGPGPDPGPAAVTVLGVSVPRQSLRAALARGLRVVLTCSTACRAGGRLVLPRAAAQRLGISPRAARRFGRLAPVDLAAGAARPARIRLSRAARRALRRTESARLVLRAHAADAAGRSAEPVRKIVALRAR